MTALPRIRFVSEPPVGLVITVNEQRYEVVGGLDHVRLDGEETRLTIWRSSCAECGAPFEFRAPATAPPQNRRCDDHKRPGVKVDPERRRRIAAASEGQP